jgi:hypothetical protein
MKHIWYLLMLITLGISAEELLISIIEFDQSLHQLRVAVAQEIQIADEQDNTALFPIEFVKQNQVLSDIMEDLPDQSSYQLPELITIENFKHFYEASKNNFKDTPLHALIDYYVYADKLDNNTLENILIPLIFSKLSGLSEKDKDYQYAKEILEDRNPEKFELLPIAVLDKKVNKILEPQAFQQLIKDLFISKNPSFLSANDIVYIYLDLNPRSLEVNYKIISKDGKLYEPIYSIENKAFTLTFNSPSQGSQSLVYDLENTFKEKSFDWKATYIFTVKSDYYKKYFVFVSPDKLAISIGAGYRPTSYETMVIELPDLLKIQKCTYIAFSSDKKKLTAIFNGKVYIIDYSNKQFTPIELPMNVFSSILVDADTKLRNNDTLLIRSSNGNTFTYDLREKHIKYFPLAQIDFYNFVSPSSPYAKRINAAGLEQMTVDDKKTISFGIDDIDFFD